MKYLNAALLSRALRMLEALFAPPRGRHSRTRVLGFRRRSTRVRRYAANPGPARRSDIRSSGGTAPARPLASPVEAFPAQDVALVRPYYTAHERSLTTDEDDRAQAEACARLARWTKDTAEPPRIPAQRPRPSGDLLAPAPPTSVRDPFVPPDLADLEKAVRTWVAQQERRRGVGV